MTILHDIMQHQSKSSNAAHYFHLCILALMFRVEASDTSCCERTFSAMNRIMTFLRTKMSADRLRCLVTIHIELKSKVGVNATTERKFFSGFSIFRAPYLTNGWDLSRLYVPGGVTTYTVAATSHFTVPLYCS